MRWSPSPYTTDSWTNSPTTSLGKKSSSGSRNSLSAVARATPVRKSSRIASCRAPAWKSSCSHRNSPQGRRGEAKCPCLGCKWPLAIYFVQNSPQQCSFACAIRAKLQLFEMWFVVCHVNSGEFRSHSNMTILPCWKSSEVKIWNSKH